MTETEELKLSKLITPKKVACFVAGNATRFVITTAIVSLVPTETKVDKARLMVGAYLISHVVSNKTSEYLSDEIDDFKELITQVKANLKKSKTDTPNQ